LKEYTMRIKEIFDQLTSGELSQVKLGGAEEGAIPEAKYPVVVNHINLALTALHTRFNLRNGSLTLDLQPTRTEYVLHGDYSTFSTKKPVADRYIQTRFANDLLKVERVLTDDGFDLALNQERNKFTITTPRANVLKVPADIVAQASTLEDRYKTQSLEVLYRASHPKVMISEGYWDPERVEIELPYSHLQALLYYVASRVHNPIGMSQEFHAGNSWYAKYEMECGRLESEGLEIDQDAESDRIYRNGWV
jgi:hypothetical protein